MLVYWKAIAVEKTTEMRLISSRDWSLPLNSIENQMREFLLRIKPEFSTICSNSCSPRLAATHDYLRYKTKTSLHSAGLAKRNSNIECRRGLAFAIQGTGKTTTKRQQKQARFIEITRASDARNQRKHAWFHREWKIPGFITNSSKGENSKKDTQDCWWWTSCEE